MHKRDNPVHGNVNNGTEACAGISTADTTAAVSAENMIRSGTETGYKADKTIVGRNQHTGKSLSGLATALCENRNRLTHEIFKISR